MTQRAPLALSEAERTRVQRVDALVARGEASVPDLIEMLGEPSWSVRRAVVAGLASLGNAAVAQLVAALRDRREDEARVAANVEALVACSGDVRTALEGLAKDENPALVADVAQILGRRRDPRAVGLLAQLTHHRDDNVAVAALEALGRIGGRAAVDSLVAAVTSGNFFRTFPAIDVLGRSGDPRAVEPLSMLLNDAYFSLEAARALGKTGDRGAVAPLMRVLERPGESFTRVAVQSLAGLQESHRARFGADQAVDAAIHQADPERRLVHRVVQSISGAEPAEQIAACAVLGAMGGDAAAAALSRLLDAPSPIADAAAAALRKLGRGSDLQIVRALVEGDSARRRVLLPIVGRGGAAPEVQLCLRDPDPAVRALACETLGRLGSRSSVPALFEMLEDPNPAVVQAASGAIQALGSADTEQRALEAARAKNLTVRRAALRMLGYFGYPSALRPFLDALQDPEPRIRDAALQGLALLEDPRALDAVRAATSDPSEKTRASALRALGLAPADMRSMAALMRGLKDRDPWARYYAAQSLGRLQAHSAAAAIAQLLADDAGQVRAAAVEALSHIGGEIPAAALLQAADSKEPDVRRAALVGLGLARRDEALSKLLQAARSDEPATRLVALSALAGYKGDAVTSALAAACADPDEGVRNAALGFLASQPGALATQTLIALLGDPVLRPRVHSTLSLPVDGRIEGLSAALRDADEERAADLASALARMKTHDSELALLDALQSPNRASRMAAAGSLAAVGSRVALAAVQRASVEDRDPEVRRVCALLLAQ